MLAFIMIILYFIFQGLIEGIIFNTEGKRLEGYYHLFRFFESAALFFGFLFAATFGIKPYHIVAAFAYGLFLYEASMNMLIFGRIIPTKSFIWLLFGNAYLIRPEVKDVLMFIYICIGTYFILQ